MGKYRFDPEVAMRLGEQVGKALLILVITWLVAKIAKWAFARMVDRIELLRRTSGNGASVGSQLGKIVSLLIWLFGLLAVLQVFNLDGVMRPVTTLLDSVMAAVPNLFGAGLIFFVGLMVARILRDLTVTALETVDFDKWINRGGGEKLTGNSQLSKTIGTIVFVLVVVPVSTMALEALQLASVSGPASDMLRLIFAAIPNIIAAAVLLGLGYLISGFIAQILKDVLPGLGVDRALSGTEILPEGSSGSAIIARVVQVAIVLFFAIAATRLLGFPELTAILDEVLTLGGRVVFGAVVIGIGFVIAGTLARLLGGTSEGTTAAAIVRYATMILFTFMGLQFMGVGEDIVRLAFGALVVGGAAAGALAFGLGGRDWAARKLEAADSAAKKKTSK